MPKANAQYASGDTRDRLVTAAQRVIAEQGWSGVTTRRVAAQAGVNAGLVHYHFDSVAGLRRAAVVAALQAAGAPAVEPPGGEISADSLSQLMAGWLRLQQDNPQTAAVLLHGSLACLHDDILRAEVESMLRQFRQALTGWLVDQGHGEEAAASLSALISAALDGALLHHLIDPTTDPTDVFAPLLELASGPATAPQRPARRPDRSEASPDDTVSTREHATKEIR